MLEIDFLPVESETGPGSKSGDAICMRFASPEYPEPIVIVIDGGYGPVGDNLAHHIRTFYGTETVDLVVSTHPDADHLNGLIRLVEDMDVRELMLHLPWEHRDDVSEYSNIEKIRDLYASAFNKGIPVTEPFEGVTRFGDRFRVLGPTVAYYEELLLEDIGEEQSRSAETSDTVVLASIQERAELEAELTEPLDDFDSVSARNNSSVISFVMESDEYHLFTGDAGITALDYAADAFEATQFFLSSTHIEFFQVPHHGSRRNLGPTILDRWFPHGGSGATAFISSALASEKHPGVAVVDELRERGFQLHATEGKHLLHHHDGKPRVAYSSSAPR